MPKTTPARSSAPRRAKAKLPEVPPPDTSDVRRARKIDRVLAQTYPDADIELDFDDPFQLLVVTVLSAQTTDRRVNGVRPALFSRYPDARALAEAEPAAVEEIIKPTGFFRAKTERIIALATALVDNFDGEVPPRMDDLVTLPGVGRKTANVVLGNGFGIPGFPVDTHVQRVGRRLGLLDAAALKDPVRAEMVLDRLIAKKDWTLASQRLIWHGRRCCHAAKPACGACSIAQWCPSYGEGPTDPEVAAKLLRTEGRA
ncbi:endonuclease III [Mumia sp. Pv 4-285]|uniref:endonuclease III n=1 Tax=Mumia qirimensis TaxID=3234852 RepID=UPI00351D84E1